MSNAVDKRIVEMSFDNKQFEDGVQTSIKSLDTFKKSLKLEDAAKGFSNLSEITKGFNLQSIAEGVKTLTDRFSTMGIVGLTVIQNLTNMAIASGKQITDALIIKPMQEGLREYETQMNAIQTVMANTSSKGTTLDQVNNALAELNMYADRTIYNFSEMTRNIGTFTAAGVDLNTSVAAIKGIANLAAVSGSNAQQASTAMYQLSQALASGTVKLMDWNSVVNAGMGGQVFQDALKETARVHGVAIDRIIKGEGSFRDSLQKGWLTSQILTETLQKFTGDLSEKQLKAMGYTDKQIVEIVKLGQTANDAATKVKTFTQLTSTIQEAIQSGWAQSWQTVLGDFEEAKQFFTGISDVLGGYVQDSSNARNEILDGWKILGGRTALVNGIMFAFQGLTNVITPLKEAFTEIFPPTTSKMLYNISYAFEVLAYKFKSGTENFAKLKIVFKGVAAVIDIIFRALSAVIGAFGKLFNSIKPANLGIMDFLVNIANYVIGLRDAVIAGDVFNKAIAKLPGLLAPVGLALKDFYKVASKYVLQIKDNILEAFSKIDLSGIKKFAEKVRSSIDLSKVPELVRGPLSEIGKILKGVGPNFSQFISIAGKFFAKVKEYFSKTFSGFEFQNPFSSLEERIKSIDFSKMFDSISKGLAKIDFDKVFNVLGTLFKGGLLGALILAIRNFLGEGKDAIASIKDVFKGIVGVLDGVKGSLEAWQSTLKAKMLKDIAIAIAILAGSLLILAMIDPAKLMFALGGITVLFSQLASTMSILSKTTGTSAKTAGIIGGLIGLAVAMAIISVAVKNLGAMDPGELANGLIVVQLLGMSLSGFAKSMSVASADVLKSLPGFIGFSLALLMLVGVIKVISLLKPEELQQGLIGLGAMLLELSLFMRIAGANVPGPAAAVGIVILAGALMLLCKAVQMFGSVNPAVLTTGLLAIGGLLAELAVFSRLSGSGLNMIAVSVGLIVLSGALSLLIPSLVALGTLSFGTILQGLLGLAGIFAVLGLAGIVLQPLIPLLAGLGLVLMTIGGAFLMVGMAITSFGAGLALIAVYGVTAVQSLVTMAQGIVANAQIITDAFTLILIGMATAVQNATPQILAALDVVMIGLIVRFYTTFPMFVKATWDLIVAIIQTTAAHIGEIIAAGAGLLVAFLQGIAQQTPAVVGAFIDIILAFIAAVAAKIPDMIQSAIDLMVAFIDGLTQGIENNMPRIITSIKNLATAIIEGLIEGLTEGGGRVVGAIVGIVKNAIKAAKSILKSESPSKVFIRIGNDTSEGFAIGIEGSGNRVVDAATNMGKVAISAMTNSISAIRDSVDSNIDMNPTIRPVVDLTDVAASGKKINGIFGQNLNMSGTLNNISSLSKSIGQRQSPIPSDLATQGQVSTVSFTQINNSPKELSRYEIFRQTRNQLSLLKGLQKA